MQKKRELSEAPVLTKFYYENSSCIESSKDVFQGKSMKLFGLEFTGDVKIKKNQ